MSKQEDLAKVSLVTILGLSILLFSLFWLKGHKFYNLEKIKVHFEDVSGLEEGSIVRWSGLRVGVVEDIKPVLKNGNVVKKLDNVKNEFLDLSNDEIKQAEEIEKKVEASKDLNEIKILKEKLEELSISSQIHLQQGIAFEQQRLKESKNHVEITLIITKKDVPIGPLSKISIVPTGLIGEQYVEISPIITRTLLDKNFKKVYITQEPLRFERFMRANIESSEAFKEAVTKINTLLKDEDVEMLIATIQDVRTVVKNVNRLVDNAGTLLSTTSEKLEQLATSSNTLANSVVEVGDNINKIIGDEQVQQDFKSTTSSLKVITAQTAKLLDEQGLAQDILEISKTAKDTSHEVSDFVKQLRQTEQELQLPKTISNINSLSDKLDKLTTELNSIVADKELKENIKVTAQKARETSENLQKISNKYSKRFLLFRLLF